MSTTRWVNRQRHSDQALALSCLPPPHASTRFSARNPYQHNEAGAAHRQPLVPAGGARRLAALNFHLCASPSRGARVNLRLEPLQHSTAEDDFCVTLTPPMQSTRRSHPHIPTAHPMFHSRPASARSRASTIRVTQRSHPLLRSYYWCWAFTGLASFSALRAYEPFVGVTCDATRRSRAAGARGPPSRRDANAWLVSLRGSCAPAAAPRDDSAFPLFMAYLAID